MPKRFHAHLPYTEVSRHLGRLQNLELPLELAVKAADLDNLDATVLQQLKEHLWPISLHAPFTDLSPGSPDPLIREATAHRFNQTLDLAEELEAHTIVFHPGYDRWKFGGRPTPWLDNSLSFWKPFVDRGAGMECQLVLENIFEETPDTLVSLLKAVDSPWFGHCFDIGHWALFGHSTLEEWFDLLGPWMTHLHLHDNHGVNDDHLPIGEGTIDFETFRSLLKKLPEEPTMTLEAHSPERLNRSLAAARELLFSPIQ